MNYQKIINNLIYSLPFYTDRFCKEINFSAYSFSGSVLSVTLSENVPVNSTITVLFLRTIEVTAVENINNCLRLEKPEELKKLYINSVEVNFIQTNNNVIELDSPVNLTPTTIVQTVDLAYLSTTTTVLTSNSNVITIDYNKVIDNLSKYTLHKVFINHKVELIASPDNVNYYIEKEGNEARILVLPLQSTSSRSIYSVTDAVTEQNLGSDFVQTRINNFTIFIYIPNDSNTKGALTINLIKSKYVQAIISSLAGFKFDSYTSPIAYKQDNLTDYNNSYIIYNIDFEFTNTFGRQNIIVNQEFLAKDFNMVGNIKNDN